MSCDFPQMAFRTSKVNGGSGALTFDPNKAINRHNPISVPCRRCVGCRLRYSSDLATRALHESKMHERSMFLTLTYDDEHLPDDYSVSVREWQLFNKKIRKHYGSGLRFLAVGEYGEQTLRPHYHALMFGLWPFDAKYFTTRRDSRVYTSAKLTEIWGKGLCEFGDVTYASAAYCARYVMKKITPDSERGLAHYWRQHPLTQQMVQVQPEFHLSSKRPALGRTWFDKYKADAFPSDFIIIDGKKKAVPSLYLQWLSEEEKTRVSRHRKPAWTGKKREHQDENKRRLHARRVIRDQRIENLKRTL